MIYVVNFRNRIKGENGKSGYHVECPTAHIYNIMRPFAFMSCGPIINNDSLEKLERTKKEYRSWLFRKLLSNTATINEFSTVLDILIQEGDLILQCSCKKGQFCHGEIIKDALNWAIQFGVDGWHDQLKMKAGLCPRCGGDFGSGGKPISGPYQCQRCTSHDYYSRSQANVSK